MNDDDAAILQADAEWRTAAEEFAAAEDDLANLSRNNFFGALAPLIHSAQERYVEAMSHLERVTERVRREQMRQSPGVSNRPQTNDQERTMSTNQLTDDDLYAIQSNDIRVDPDALAGLGITLPSGGDTTHLSPRGAEDLAKGLAAAAKAFRLGVRVDG